MGSILGAILVFLVPAETLPMIIPIAMLVVLGFLLINPRKGLNQERAPSRRRVQAGYLMAFVLAVYGGFFSGGYVTMLIAACVFCFGYSFLRAVAMSRLMNIASSSIAGAVFAWHGAIAWKLALSLGCAAFAGALAGAHWARWAPERLLRAIFVTAVAALALKSLIFDIPWPR